jgi:LemA protein
MIPLLIEIVNNYAKHENSTFTIVTQLRSQWGAAKTTKDKIKNANKLEAALAKLLVMQEQYPQLKANENFQSLQQNASEMETQILIERRNYNEIVKEYNIQVKLFPKNIVAKIFRFSERDFYSNKDIQGAVEPGLAMHGSEMRSTAEQGKGF